MRHPPSGFVAPLPLGEGGQARTFLCWQGDPGRWVVLKTDPRDRGELDAEAELLERLPGAPVPALLARSPDGSRPWIAMSWIDGIRLDALPDGLETGAVHSILAATARSVAALHGRGVVHGDLAGSNILALPGGEAILVDLGMASIGGARSGGAWETFPTERIQGRPASTASDVFALGVLALRLLGRLPEPWTRSRADWTRAVLENALPDLARDLPVVARATAMVPEERPTALEFANAIGGDARDWPRERLRRKARDDFDALLRRGIETALQHRNWADAWRFQRERIERSDDPELLLPELGRFARERDARAHARRKNPWAALGAILALAVATFLVMRHVAPSTGRRQTIPVATDSLRPPPEFTYTSTVPVESFPLPSIPPGASLRVDGLPTDMPADGLLLLAVGRHRIQLRDAVGTLLLDTLWIALPSRPAEIPHR